MKFYPISDDTITIIGDFTNNVPKLLPANFEIIMDGIYFYRYCDKDGNFIYNKNSTYAILDDGEIYNYLEIAYLNNRYSFPFSYAFRASLLNDQNAMLQLSLYHYYNTDWKTSTYYLNILLQNNYIGAYYIYGNLYLYEHKIRTAIYYWILGANQGCEDCIESLYYNDNCEKWLKIAIKQGCDWILGPIYYGFSSIACYYNIKKTQHIVCKKQLSKYIYKIAKYYKNVEHNYEQMEKYFIIAIKYGHLKASYKLAKYYLKTKDYNNFLQIANNNTKQCIYLLSVYYSSVNYDKNELSYCVTINMFKYKCIKTAYYIALFYKNNKKYNKMLRILMDALNYNDFDTIKPNIYYELGAYYYNIVKNYDISKSYLDTLRTKYAHNYMQNINAQQIMNNIMANLSI